MASINIYSVFRLECPHIQRPAAKSFAVGLLKR